MFIYALVLSRQVRNGQGYPTLMVIALAETMLQLFRLSGESHSVISLAHLSKDSWDEKADHLTRISGQTWQR